MGIIDQSNADVFATAFTDADAMPGVEACTYKPYNSTNGVSVNLQVNRHPPEVPPEPGRGRAWDLTVFLPAGNTNIASINTQGDRVSIAPAYGAAVQDLAVVEILNQSPAGWILQLR